MDYFYLLHSWLRSRLGRDERGATLVEYVLLVSMIAIAVIGAVVFLGSQLSPRFSQAGSAISTASGP